MKDLQKALKLADNLVVEHLHASVGSTQGAQAIVENYRNENRDQLTITTEFGPIP